MATLTVNIKEDDDTRKTEAMRMTKGTVTAGKKKQSFEEAVTECNGITAEEFFSEVRRQISEHYDNA